MIKLKSFKLKHLSLLILVLPLLTIVFLSVKNQVIAQSKVTAAASDDIINDLNKQIKEQQDKIDALAGKIDEYNSNIKEAKNKAISLQNQVYIINNQIAKTNLDIEAKEQEVKIVGLQIDQISLQIKDNQETIARDKKQLAEFIRQLHYSDKKGYLEVLLGNNSFSEFFDQVKYLEDVSRDVNKTLGRVREETDKLDSQKKDLNNKRNQLATLLNKLESQKATLDDQKSEKQYLVVQTKNSEKKFQSLVGDLKQQQLEANNAVANLEKKLRAELEKKGAAEKFNSFGTAALAWPASKRIITTYFHDPEYPYRNLFEHSGIDLAISMGTSVKSAEAGYVAKVATGTKWYGNYILIIHNNNLATLYGHLTSISVKADQYVTKGQEIGKSGSTGFSSGPHLHFEVRYNGIPVDPMNYLP